LRRIGADDADRLPELFEQRYRDPEMVVRASGHDEALARRRCIGPAEHCRRNEAPSAFTMHHREFLRGGHADRAHRDVQRAWPQSSGDACFAEGDRFQRSVIGHHREHDLG
jgi:hypothetical protein